MTILQRIKRFIMSLRHVFKRTTIKAVHEEDLLGVLASLGVLAGIERGEYGCVCCDKVVTMENLWGILSKDGSIHVICSDPECIMRLD